MNMTYMTKIKDKAEVVVIGGGAAGMMAAISAARAGASVTLLEQMERCGRKLRITGKGRCNVTNDSTNEELMQNVTTNPKFLYASFSRLSSRDVCDFFEGEGVPLKVERGKRVFPVSDKAVDIVDALVRACRREGVKTVFDKAKGIDTENGRVTAVVGRSAVYECDSVVVSTGGVSYPQTGSDGSGKRRNEMAEYFDLPSDMTPNALLGALNLLTDKNGFFSAAEALWETNGESNE